MMNMLSKSIFAVVIIALWFTSGCELVTDNKIQQPPPVKGDDLIINEVFTLSPSKYYAYSWIEMFNPTNREIGWFENTFPATGHVVGAAGTILRTENDGIPWSSISPFSNPDFYSVFFSYPDTGYVVGGNGTIKIIRKLGSTYDFSDPVTNPAAGRAISLKGVAGPTFSPTLYAVGDSGYIMRSINRGSTWTKQTTNTTKNLNGVYFESFVAIYAVGDSGTILKSPSANQWQPRSVGAAYQSNNFQAVYFQSDTGIVVGENGAILVSRNGGGTWFPESSGVSVTLRAVFYNRGYNKAWVAGDNGVILMSEDGFKTWTPQPSGTTNSLRTIVFADQLKGWAAGANGTILHTTDGGDSWTLQESGTTANLYSMQFNPRTVRVRNRLVLEMWAKRNVFFLDPRSPFIEGVNPNFDFIVFSDTGKVFYDPGLLFDLSGGFFDPPPPVPPQGFVIINSDSLRFKDHTDIGPGHTDFLNFAVSFTDTSVFRATGVLWDLLDAGELRLVRTSRKQLIAGGVDIGPQTTAVVDVVRWGGYRPDPSLYLPEHLYPNNEPAGFIPEWYSLSRYVNDAGGPVNQISTAASFYMSPTPIPGWYSQKGK